MLNASVFYTGSQNLRPPSRIPKTRSIDTARRSALCRANTEFGIAGRKRRGEEYEAWKLVADDEYEQPEVERAAYRREAGRRMCIYHGVVKSTRLVGMSITITVQRDTGVVMFHLTKGYTACYGTGPQTTENAPAPINQQSAHPHHTQKAPTCPPDPHSDLAQPPAHAPSDRSCFDQQGSGAHMSAYPPDARSLFPAQA